MSEVRLQSGTLTERTLVFFVELRHDITRNEKRSDQLQNGTSMCQYS